MGIAHHANYLVWFELGRTDLCRAAGMTYRSIEERGLILVVSEVQCRYVRPFGYDTEVRIETSVAELGSRKIGFRYEISSDEGGAASGATSHIWVDRDTRRPVRAPEEIAAIFEAWRS